MIRTEDHGHMSEHRVMRKLVKNEMETALELSVPLLVDINLGNNWGELK